MSSNEANAVVLFLVSLTRFPYRSLPRRSRPAATGPSSSELNLDCVDGPEHSSFRSLELALPSSFVRLVHLRPFVLFLQLPPLLCGTGTTGDRLEFWRRVEGRRHSFLPSPEVPPRRWLSTLIERGG